MKSPWQTRAEHAERELEKTKAENERLRNTIAYKEKAQVSTEEELAELQKRIESAPITHCVEFEGSLLLTDSDINIVEGKKYALLELTEGE